MSQNPRHEARHVIGWHAGCERLAEPGKACVYCGRVLPLDDPKWIRRRFPVVPSPPVEAES